MSIPSNPYIAGAPLRGQTGFFGRQAVLEWVERELRNPNTNALVLFGQRRIGKTTLLLQLQRTLPEDAFLPVYFDLQDQAQRTLGVVLADLADTIAEHAGMALPETEAFDNSGRYFQTKFLEDLYKALNGRRPVLLLDEFDVLDQTAERELPDSAATKALFPFLRRLMLEEPSLAFVFVVGRRAEDLTLDFSATFKASLTREIWALDQESAVDLIRQAEESGTLTFSNEAIERILQLSSGHPYLIQLLCQRIWEQAHEKETDEIPLIDLPFVDAAVPNSLEAGYQAFAWLWDGLSPAEKIYTAAFAEATDEGGTISEDEVIRILATHAARLRTQEVEMAPLDLVRRRVLTEVADHIYCFNIELFRRWIRAYKPLREVKDELDQIDPLADQTFEVGRSFFMRRRWDIAARYFRDALIANPRHLKARLFLGEALLSLGEVDQAVHELEAAFALDRDEARLPLARALIAQAKTELNAGDEDAALGLLNQALDLSPQEYEALDIKADIWTARGNQALEEDDLEAALDCFEKAGNKEKSGQVRALMQLRALAALENEARAYEGQAQWVEAAGVYEQLLAQEADEERKAGWQRSLDRVADEAELSRLFDEGLEHLEEEEWQQAQGSFAEIVHRRPGYSKDGQTAIRLLEKAVKEGPSEPVWRRPLNWAIVFSGTVVILLILWAVFQAGGKYLPGLSAPPATNTASDSSAVISDLPSTSTATASKPAVSQAEQAPAAAGSETTEATPTPSRVTRTPTAESQASTEVEALMQAYGEELGASRNEEALDLLNQAIELDPEYQGAYAERGWLYYHQFGDLDAALSDFTRSIELKPEEAWIYDERALVNKDLGNTLAALADWANCLAFDPDFHSCYGNRANYAREQGDSERAFEDINNAIALEPNIAGYYDLRGDLNREAGADHEAIADYSKSIELDPNFAHSYFWRGGIYLHRLNDLEKALADFNQAINLDPTPWLYMFRATVFARSGLVQEALADIQSAIDSADDPGVRSDIHSEVGKIFLEDLDDPETALLEFDAAIEIDPTYADAYLTRGFNYYYQFAADHEAALEDIDRAIELEPDRANYFESRGVVQREIDQTLAESDFEKCLEVDPNYYWCHFHLGDLYKELGDTDSAVSHYWDFLTIVPESECRECQEEAVDYLRNNTPGEVELFASGFYGPFGMAFDQDRNLYVANENASNGRSSVSKVSHDGQLSTVITGLTGASGLAFNSDGILHVSDDEGQINRVSDDGSSAVFVTADIGLNNPNAIAFDSGDNLYVVNHGSGNVAVFDSKGELINLELARGINEPQAIVIDENAGVLYVSDRDGNIKQIDKMTGSYTTYASTNSRTEGGLVADEQGNLFLSAINFDSVMRIDFTDQTVSVCLSDIAAPRGLAFDSRGILYITGRESGKIYRVIGCQP
jgi:tetratricopeptide (TPR) repeat protein